MSTKDSSYCDNDVDLLTMSCIPFYRGLLSYAKSGPFNKMYVSISL